LRGKRGQNGTLGSHTVDGGFGGKAFARGEIFARHKKANTRYGAWKGEEPMDYVADRKEPEKGKRGIE